MRTRIRDDAQYWRHRDQRKLLVELAKWDELIAGFAGKLSDGDWASVPIAGKNGPLDKTLGVCDNVSVFKTDTSKQDAIRKFLDFTYQDKYQLAFDHEYDLLPATNSAIKTLSSDPVFAPFLKAHGAFGRRGNSNR